MRTNWDTLNMSRTAETPYCLIDLPEFGSLADWQQALAELSTAPMTPQIVDAINRCRDAIAELEGNQRPSIGERWKVHGMSIDPPD